MIQTIGIDYSLNSPAVCICTVEKLTYTTCEFHYLTSKKKFEGIFNKNIHGHLRPEYNSPTERFSNISDWVLKLIKEKCNNPMVFIEGYSFGSKGQAVFQIAENGGILKYKLYKENIPFDLIVPSVVKKNATTKGNADKQLMYDTFKKDTKQDLMKVFDQKTLTNPVTDIIDSFYISQVGRSNYI